MRKAIILLFLILTGSVFGTVPSGESIRQYFDADDVDTTFTFTIPANSSDDYLVYKHLESTGVETLLVVDSTYTIAPTGNSYLNGGVVTISPALASTYKVVVVRNIKKSQETAQGAITPKSIVASLDKIARSLQDLEDRNDRSWHLPESDSTAFNMEIPGLALRAETYPYFDISGNITYVSGVTPDDVVVTPYMETVLDDNDAETAMTTLSGIPVANLKTLGAVGDGVTDDTAALVAALASGMPVYVPVGTFMTDPFTVPDGVSIHGAGYDVATIKLNAGSDATLMTLASSGNHRAFSGFALDGNQGANVSTSYCLYADQNFYGRFNRVKFFNANDGGIFLEGCNAFSFRDCFINGNFGFGAKIGGTTTNSCEEINFRDCQIENNENYGLHFISDIVGHINNVTGCWFEVNSSAVGAGAINHMLINADAMYVTGNRFTMPTITADAIDVLTGSKFNMFLGNVFIGSPIAGVGIDLNSGADENICIGNTGQSITTVDSDGNNFIIEHRTSTVGSYYANSRAIPTLTDSATPSIKGSNLWKTGGTTSISNLLDNFQGQLITIIAEHTIEIIDGTDISLKGLSNWTMNNNDTLVLITKSDGNYYEVSRTQAANITAVTAGADPSPGEIPEGSLFVVVTSDTATKQIELPTAITGSVIRIKTPAIGCELICVGSNVKINDVICSVTNEAALAADSHFIAECISQTEWILRGFTELGANISAIVPDAR